MECCICGNKIKAFGGGYICIGNVKFSICHICNENKKALVSMSEPDKNGETDAKKARRYFENYIKDESMSEEPDEDFIKALQILIDDSLSEEANNIKALEIRKEKEKREQEIRQKELELRKKQEQELERKRLSFKHTTGFNFEGYKIVEYKGIVSGEVVLGTGFLSEFGASISDILGTQSNMFANKMIIAKHGALEKLTENAISRGSNALIGVDFDYITLSNNMLGVSANGTAVVIEKEV